MELEFILNSRKKTIRKLKYLWIHLVNRKNFLIPETIQEAFQFGIEVPRIKIEPFGECFFNEKSRIWLTNFVSTIYEIPEIKHSVSYGFIYRTTKSFIEKSIYEQLKHSLKPDPHKNIVNIIQALINAQGHYQFFRIVEGIKLEGVESLMLGDVEIFVFTNVYEKEFQDYCKYNINRYVDSSVDPFIKKNFMNKICMSTTAVGEERRAEEIATKKIGQVVSVLRFVVCLLRPETIYDNRVKINLLSESYNPSENTMAINLDNKGISLSWGVGRKHLSSLPIDAELLRELKDNCFFDDLLSMLKNEKRTELEENILTSVYWIGEAQNDFVYESAFIKCWTALETIFSTETKEIEESLGRGVSILLAFGGYRFIKIDEIEEVYKKVRKLYDKRCKVIHRGVYEIVSPLELLEVCKYAVWSILTCLELRNKGYEKLEQIRIEANRLYEASRSHLRGRNRRTRT